MKTIKFWEIVKRGKPKKVTLNNMLDQVNLEEKGIYEVKTEGHWERIPVKLDSKLAKGKHFEKFMKKSYKTKNSHTESEKI